MKRPDRPRSLLAALVVIPFSACGTDAPASDAGSLEVERETVGDTMVVRIKSGSVWGAPARVSEHLSIGALEGPEEITFGFIHALAVDDAGGIYLFDSNVPVLRYFDADGSFVRNLGREGAGPGEYYDTVLGLAVRSDGRPIMRDPRNGRINVYERDGSPSESWPVASGLFSQQSMTLDTLDHVYLKILLGPTERGKQWPIGLLHLNERGEIVDSIAPPELPNEPTHSGNGNFLAQKEWALSPYRQMIVGVSDRYAFEIRDLDGPGVIRVERAWTPIPLAGEEREEWQARQDWMWERQGQYMTSEMEPLPDRKPAYRSFSAGLDGTIWVHLHVPAEKREVTAEPDDDSPPPLTWVEPTVFDVFEPDGTYLGEVRIPPRTRIHVFTRETLWGIRRGALDEEYVVRLRVLPT